MKKFKLTPSQGMIGGREVYRIKALKDFNNVKKGDLGGFVEHEENLSQEGDCWIYDDACVLDKARIEGDAIVRNNAKVSGVARIYDNARINGCGSLIHEKAQIYGYAIISDNATIYGNAKVYGDAIVGGYVRLCGNSRIYGNVTLIGTFDAEGDADISSSNDYAVVKGFGRANRDTTFYLTKDRDIYVTCGCFNGTLQQFREQVRKTHGTNEYAKEYLMIADLMEKRFKLRKGLL